MNFDAVKITQLVGSKSPLNLLDQVISEIPGKEITALKLVSMNEPYFQGHFPANPIMPGVLNVESMIQAARVLVRRRQASFSLRKIRHARFRQMVRPGEQLMIKVKKKEDGSFQGQAFLKDKLACSADLYFTLSN